MDFEFFIIIALIVIFFVSCCGLIQKLKENYDDDRGALTKHNFFGFNAIMQALIFFILGRVISAAHISPMQCPNQIFNNSAYQPDDFSSGVYPAVIAPPPYLGKYLLRNAFQLIKVICFENKLNSRAPKKLD